MPVRLHLGCGERYLEGYVNIDYPSSEHTVQQRSVADRHADLRTLAFEPGSVQEVRLHHVFEHFPRPQALALAASWARWLAPGGVLHIEVPDFERSARHALSPFRSRASRMAALRHLFGSHEAAWAVHCEGWSEESLRLMARGLGFEVRSMERTRWKSTYNLTMVAAKARELAREEAAAAARAYMADFRVDDGPTEARLLEAWMGLFEEQLQRGWPA